MAGKALLLRAWLDTGSLGGQGYYSPLHPSLGCATLIPVPEEEAKPVEHLDPEKTLDPCTGEPYSRYQPLGKRWLLHHDPRLDLGFYTDHYAPKGRLPRRPGRRLTRGDLIVFLAGLAVYPEGFWSRPRSHAAVRAAFRRAVSEGRAAVYIAGVLLIDAVVDTSRSGWSHAVKLNPWLRMSPHYARPGDTPAAVIGRGFLVEPPAPVSMPARGSLDAVPPSTLLEQLIGPKPAWGLARNRYRRSRVVSLTHQRLSETLENHGYSLKPAQPRSW